MTALRRIRELSTHRAAISLTGLLLAPALHAAPVGGAGGAGLLQHSYYDCDSQDARGTTRESQEARREDPRQDGSAPSCRVYYAVEKERLGVELEDPQQAYRLPELAAADPAIVATCLPAGSPPKVLELDSLDKKNPKIAAYKLLGCKSESAALWLARELTGGAKTSSHVTDAGLLIRRATEPDRYLLVDDLLVRVAQALELPPAPPAVNLLAAVDLEFIAPDPFDPEHSALLRATHPAGGAAGPSSLDGIDLLTCVATEKGEAEEVVERCLGESDAGEDIVRSMTGKGRRDAAVAALRTFHALGPELLHPKLIPVSAKAPGADFEVWLKAEKKKEDDFTSKITFNSVSNDTDREDKARLSVDAAVNRGSYPGQLRFALGAQVEFDGSAVEENVTSLVVNYDHYFRPWFEVYGFVERFSNSFMGIDQRWEGGGGVLFEYDVRAKSRDRFCDGRANRGRGYSGPEVALTRSARERMAQYRDAARQELLRSGFIKRETLESYCTYAPGVAKRNARLQLGLALSAFSDFEQPDAFDLTAQWADEQGAPTEREENPATMEITPPSSQRLHYTLRPSITWRPSSGLRVDALYYHKFAASPEVVPWEGSDDRGQWRVAVDFTLHETSPKVSLTGSLTRTTDSRPPRLSAVEVFDQFGLMPLPGAAAPAPADTTVVGLDTLGLPVLIDGFVAADRYTEVKFGVTVSF